MRSPTTSRRAWREAVFQPEGWDIVRQLFQAKETDARLGRFAWMPQCLIDGAAPGPLPAVANGFLGLETAWQEVLQRFLRIPAARPDAVSLLTWSMTTGADARLDQLPAAQPADVMRWLSNGRQCRGNGPGLRRGGSHGRRLATGAGCGVVFAPEGEGQAAAGQAAIRPERFVNDKHIGVPEGRPGRAPRSRWCEQPGWMPRAPRSTVQMPCCGTCASPSSRT